MKRREFIGLVGGAATWPVVARAQQADRKRRVGLLLGRPADDRSAIALIETLRESLQVIGWSEARNIRIDYRITSDVAR